MSAPRSTTQYQFSTATTTPAEAVLDGISALELPDDLCINERGSTYLVIGPPPSSYDGRTAVALAGAVVLAVLILTAFWIVAISFLPLGLLPLVPLLLRDHPLLAVGAVREDDGSTRVTVHGQAPGRLTTALDLFLSRLPIAEHVVIPDPGNGNGHGSNGTLHRDDEGPIRAPERTTAE
jgi:hypothetical protein